LGRLLLVTNPTAAVFQCLLSFEDPSVLDILTESNLGTYISVSAVKLDIFN